MSKLLTLYAADGVTAAPAVDFGSVAPGTVAASRQLVLKNTGTEAIPSIQASLQTANGANGTYTVVIGGVTLTTTPVELLTAPLAVNGTLSISEAWSTPAGAATGTVVFNSFVLNYFQ